MNVEFRIKNIELRPGIFLLCLILCTGVFPSAVFSQEAQPAPPPAEKSSVINPPNDYMQRRAQIAALKYFSKLAEEILEPTAATAPTETSEPVKKLISQLGSEHFKVREKATNELIQMGPSIRAEMIAASKSKDPETSFRAKKILSSFKEVEGEKPKPRFEQYVFNTHVSSYLRAKDTQLIPMLIAFLGHPNKQVKLTSWQYLTAFTEQNFSNSDIPQWKKWWSENQDTFKFKQAPNMPLVPFNGPINNMIMIDE